MILDQYTGQIVDICKKLNVKHLFVFGSIITDRFNENSDVDFIVDINSDDPFDYAENYFELKFQLEDLLKRPIDLLEERALKNKYLKFSIETTKKLIYAA